jgi:hypothetical protein
MENLSDTRLPEKPGRNYGPARISFAVSDLESSVLFRVNPWLTRVFFVERSGR